MAQIKAHLQALVAENKARCAGKTPDALHLYMGFGAVEPEERNAASAFALVLRHNAAALAGQLGDPECEQMVEWLCAHWKAYESIHTQKESGKASATNGYRKSMIQMAPLKFSAKGSEEASASAHTSDDKSVAPLPVPKPVTQTTAPKPVPRTGAATSDMSATSYGSRMEQSTASEAQELKTHRRRATDASTSSKATTTTNHSKSVTTLTTTSTTTTAATTGIKTRAEGPRELKDPLHKITTKAESQRGNLDLKNPDEILRRAKVRDDLFAALDAQDDAKVTSILSGMPPVASFSKYFPPPSPLDSLESTYASAQRYATAHGGDPLKNYLRKCAWNARMHAEILERMQKDPAMRKLYPLEVQSICCGLAACPETHIKTNAKAMEIDIKTAMKAMKAKDLEEHLAQQPFAALKLLEHRCTLLEHHTQGKTVREFHKIVAQARLAQNTHGERLANALLKITLDEVELKPLIRKNYAMQVTTSPADYVADGRTWVEVEKIRENIDLLLQRAKLASPDGKSWEVTMLTRMKERADSTMKKLEDPNAY